MEWWKKWIKNRESHWNACFIVLWLFFCWFHKLFIFRGSTDQTCPMERSKENNIVDVFLLILECSLCACKLVRSFLSLFKWFKCAVYVGQIIFVWLPFVESTAQLFHIVNEIQMHGIRLWNQFVNTFVSNKNQNATQKHIWEKLLAATWFYLLQLK